MTDAPSFIARAAEFRRDAFDAMPVKSTEQLREGGVTTSHQGIAFLFRRMREKGYAEKA